MKNLFMGTVLIFSLSFLASCASSGLNSGRNPNAFEKGAAANDGIDEKPEIYIPWTNPLETSAAFVPKEPDFVSTIPPDAAVTKPETGTETLAVAEKPAVNTALPAAPVSLESPAQAAQKDVSPIAAKPAQRPAAIPKNPNPPTENPSAETPKASATPPLPPKTVRPAEMPSSAVNIPQETMTRTAVLPARLHPTETEPKEKNLFSRSVRALTGQIVEVPFRGTGWVYLGEQDSKRGITYQSRRLDNDGQTFIFQADSPGSYHLKFSKQDFVNNMFINDTVEVITGDEDDGSAGKFPTADTQRVSAGPRWPLPGDLAVSGAETAAAKAVSQDFTGQTSFRQTRLADISNTGSQQTTDAQIPVENASFSGGAVSTPNEGENPVQKIDYLTQARSDFSAGKFPDLVNSLDQYRNENISITDEMWWFYGQAFESNSPVRDIKAAVDSYQHITRDFPLSKYYDDAKGRIAYLNKFYFNIR